MSTTARPYFLWDYDLTEADVQAILQAGDDTERFWLVSCILESARYEDVWKYLSLAELRPLFPHLRLKPEVQSAWGFAMQVWDADYRRPIEIFPLSSGRYLERAGFRGILRVAVGRAAEYRPRPKALKCLCSIHRVMRRPILHQHIAYGERLDGQPCWRRLPGRLPAADVWGTVRAHAGPAHPAADPRLAHHPERRAYTPDPRHRLRQDAGRVPRALTNCFVSRWRRVASGEWRVAKEASGKPRGARVARGAGRIVAARHPPRVCLYLSSQGAQQRYRA